MEYQVKKQRKFEIIPELIEDFGYFSWTPNGKPKKWNKVSTVEIL